jgi:hypothetical protein
MVLTYIYVFTEKMFMYNKAITTLLLSFIIPFYLYAQTLPEEGGALNYRIIGFSIPAAEKTNTYTLEIAAGKFMNEDSFKQKVIFSLKSKNNKIIAEVPSFGSEYTWRMSPGNEMKANSQLHHFSTTSSPYVDTNITRLRIISPAEKYNDSYVFSDGGRALYDMKGNPVWYLPGFRENHIIRDLKMTQKGTITFLENENAREIDYNAAELWRAPRKGVVSGDSTEHFHHEFTRLSNGHYMVLGTEFVLWKNKPTGVKEFPPGTDAAKKAKRDSIIANQKSPFGTVLEYDEKGNLVWSWKSFGYFSGSDLTYYNQQFSRALDVHENAFWFDEPNKMLYVSYKNISRILKIQYPGGNVTNVYGEIYRPDTPPSGNKLFCDQHGSKLSKQGYLYLYDNNSCNEGKELPKVLILQEPLASADTLKKIWEYECSVEGLDMESKMKILERRKAMFEKAQKMRAEKHQPLLIEETSMNSHATSGGNVIELPDRSLFVCMNSDYGKIFIVNLDKKILWSAVNEKWRQNEKRWLPIPQQYRASIISRKDLEKLIWKSEIPE